MKYNNLLSEGLIFRDSSERAEGGFDQFPYTAVWEYDDLVVFSLNSAVHDGPDKQPHHGRISADQIEKIEDIISENKFSEKIKIFVLHHHQFLKDNQPHPGNIYNILLTH